MHKFTRAVREAADALLPNASQRDRVIYVITVVMFDRWVWSLVPFLKPFRGRLVGLVHVANFLPVVSWTKAAVHSGWVYSDLR